MAVGPPVGGVLYEVSVGVALSTLLVCTKMLAMLPISHHPCPQAGGFSLPFQVIGGVSLLFLVPCFLLVKGSGRCSACVSIMLTMPNPVPFLECKGQPSSWKILKTLGSNFIIILLR